MKSVSVKNLMVPLSEYATVDQNATLFEAVQALEAAQRAYARSSGYLHRAVLVYDENRRIVGKLSQLDVLRALEPKYSEMGSTPSLSRFGLSPQFMRSLREQYSLLDKPLSHLCESAAKVNVKNCMYTPTEGEYVEESDSLDQAVHQLVMGHHQSLLVTREGDIVGVLRLTDVFNSICEAMKECEI